MYPLWLENLPDFILFSLIYHVPRAKHPGFSGYRDFRDASCIGDRILGNGVDRYN
jgi:hypothetical protein